MSIASHYCCSYSYVIYRETFVYIFRYPLFGGVTYLIRVTSVPPITLPRLTPGVFSVFFVAFVVRRFLLSLPLPLASRAALAHRWWRLCGSPAPRSGDGWL